MMFITLFQSFDILILIFCFSDDYVPRPKQAGDLNRVINYASRHAQVTVILVVHGLLKTNVFSEVITAPLVLFTYSGNSWTYLKRTCRDRGLEAGTFTEAFRRQQRASAYGLGLVDWSRNFLVVDLLQLLGPQGSCLMWKQEVEYIIHARSETCPNSDSPAPTHSTGEAELEGFPWGKRGQRLLKFLQLKGVVSVSDDVIEGIPLVDFLKVVVCTEPPPSSGRVQAPQQEKILKILKKLKASGIAIPAAYIVNRSCREVFWRTR